VTAIELTSKSFAKNLSSLYFHGVAKLPGKKKGALAEKNWAPKVACSGEQYKNEYVH